MAETSQVKRDSLEGHQAVLALAARAPDRLGRW